MAKTVNNTIQGQIIKIFTNAQFSVQLDNFPNTTLCYLAGKISKKHTKPTVGDRVKVEIYPQDLTRGRIISIIYDK